MEIDLKILFQKPELDKKVVLTILPLAPLSMVSDIPGTYYKSQEVPDKYKLCGLFENMLGWHFCKKDREAIVKKVKEFHVKKLKNKDFEVKESNSGFKPLLYDFFEVGLVVKPQSHFYNDLVKMAGRRTDADVHPKGTPNLDYDKLKQKNIVRIQERLIEQYKDEKKKLDKNKELNKDRIEELKKLIPKQGEGPLLDFFKENLDSFPMYYSSPVLREYTYIEGVISYSLNIQNSLMTLLQNSLKDCSSGYMGNSEGWVELKIEES